MPRLYSSDTFRGCFSSLVSFPSFSAFFFAVLNVLPLDVPRSLASPRILISCFVVVLKGSDMLFGIGRLNIAKKDRG